MRHGRLMAGAAMVAVAGMAALGATSANAARLATPKEAKALRAAFDDDPGHKKLQITSAVVATSDRSWARVNYARPLIGAKNAAAEKASGNADYQLSGSRSHPHAKPAKGKPPHRVAKDLDEPVWVRITYQGSATENATDTFTASGDCGGEAFWNENFRFTADDAWNWHITRYMDFNKAKPSAQIVRGKPTAAVAYRSPAGDPTFGDGSEKLAYNDDFTDESCNSDDDFTGTASAHITKASYVASKPPLQIVPGIGLILMIPAPLGPTVTSDGDPHYNELSDRLPLLASAVDPSLAYIGIPFLDISDPSSLQDVPSYSFTFAKNSLGTSATSTNDGYCAEGRRGDCSDTVDYFGTVSIDIGEGPTAH